MEEDLDAILQLVREHYSAIPFTIDQLFIEAKARPLSDLGRRSLEVNLLSDYVKYLVSKDFLRIEANTDQGTYYKITPLGKVHISSGGFVRQKEIETSYRQSTLSTNSSVIRTNRFQIVALCLTSLIAASALILQYYSYKRNVDTEMETQALKTRVDSIFRSVETIKIRQQDMDNTLTQREFDSIKKLDTIKKSRNATPLERYK